MRCFLAVPVSEPALPEAQLLLQTLTGRIDGVRWVRPDGLHLTVHFFGSIDSAAEQGALQALAPVAATTREFLLTLDRLGSFPPRGRPHVLWLGSAREQEALATLALRCRDALQRGGFSTAARPFHAHCTLGRPVAWSPARQETWIRTAQEVRPMTFVATQLVLYESVTGRGGAVYTPRQQLRFATAES